MRTFSTILGLLLGLALLAALAAGGYFLFKYAVTVFGTLEPQVATITATASVVALLCAAIIGRALKSRSAHGGASVQKANVYERLAACWAAHVQGERAGVQDRTDDRYLADLEQLLALHGSPKVIAAHMQLRRAVRDVDKEGSYACGLMNKLVRAMRADLGRRESNMNEKDILALLVGRI
jgi:hypothetical protein